MGKVPNGIYANFPGGFQPVDDMMSGHQTVADSSHPVLTHKAIVVTQPGACGVPCCHQQVVTPIVNETALKACNKSA